MLEYPNKLNNIFDKLNKFNIKPIIVGGYVRDYFLKYSSKDIDIELYNVEKIEDIENILKEFGDTNSVGKSFGVIKLSLDNLDLDFSLPRLDSKVSKGHKGFKIETFKTLDFKTASKRRDFTINAIGYDPTNSEFLDFYNGIDDIKNKILNYIDKESFQEDPLRVYRAVQFSSRFEFKISKELFSTCRDMIEQGMLDELPKQRVFIEIKKLLLKSKKPSIGLKLLEKLDIKLFDIDDKKLELIDKFTQTNITNTKIKLSVMLALLYMDSEKSFSMLSDSKSIDKNIEIFLALEAFFKNKKSITYNMAKDIDLENISIFLQAIDIEEKILDNLELLRPKLHGKDLIKKGLKPSKEFSKILQKSYDDQTSKLHSL
jgi:tRNA nucleotidyltransferase (CCA-adding enzyme)